MLGPHCWSEQGVLEWEGEAMLQPSPSRGFLLQNHKIRQVGEDPSDPQVQLHLMPPCPLPTSPSATALNTSRDGDPQLPVQLCSASLL